MGPDTLKYRRWMKRAPAGARAALPVSITRRLKYYGAMKCTVRFDLIGLGASASNLLKHFLRVAQREVGRRTRPVP